MLAFALRRAIWAIPTFFGVSLVVFLLTTLLPEPELDRSGRDQGGTAARIHLDELRRARFLDLPRFFNVAPQDVRSKVEACIPHLVANDQDAPLCEARLVTMGGAAFPHLLPRLDTLPPEARGRVAVALAPVAARMGVGQGEELGSPDRAAVFWSRFWEDRSVDFTEPAMRRAVKRYGERSTELREEDVRLLDTFALGEVLGKLRTTRAPAARARLTSLAADMTGRASVLRPDADEREARAVVSGWLSWWYVHETDYVTLRGGEKVAASLVQTRYAKWVLGAAIGRLGLSARDGEPIFDKLMARAPVTLGMAFLALLLGALIAIPLGVLAAWRRGGTVDLAVVLGVLALYGVPTFLVAQLLATIGDAAGDGLVLPVLALATVSLSTMTNTQRAAMIDALGQDYVRAARAKGARTLRVAIVHALRNALVPTATLAGVQLPAIIGGAFLVEEIFGIQGVGWETLRAIESRDIGWIVAATLLCAVATTISLIASDVAYGLLDPRVRERQARTRPA